MDIGKQEKFIENMLSIEEEQSQRFQTYKILAIDLFKFYNEFISAGFTETQALYLVGKQLAAINSTKVDK